TRSRIVCGCPSTITSTPTPRRANASSVMAPSEQGAEEHGDAAGRRDQKEGRAGPGLVEHGHESAGDEVADDGPRHEHQAGKGLLDAEGADEGEGDRALDRADDEEPGEVGPDVGP